MNTKEHYLTSRMVKQIWHGKVIILITAIIFAVIFYIYSALFATPVYRSSFTVFVNNRSSNMQTEQITNADTAAAQSLTQTYSALIKTPEIIQKAIEQEKLDCDTATASGWISTNVVQGTQLINVNVDSNSSTDSYLLASGLSSLAPKYISDIIEGTSMRIVTNPAENKVPVWPNKKEHALLGAVFGLFVSFAVVCIRAITDVRVHEMAELEEQYNLPVLGSISTFENVAD